METTAKVMATNAAWIGDVRAVIYPIQFESNPRNGVDRVVGQIIAQQDLEDHPEQVLMSIRQALASDLDLSQLLPQDHSDEQLRDYLGTLERQLTLSLQSREAGAADPGLSTAPPARVFGTLARDR